MMEAIPLTNALEIVAALAVIAIIARITLR